MMRSMAAKLFRRERSDKGSSKGQSPRTPSSSASPVRMPSALRRMGSGASCGTDTTLPRQGNFITKRSCAGQCGQCAGHANCQCSKGHWTPTELGLVQDEAMEEIKAVRLPPELLSMVRSAPWKAVMLRCGFKPLTIKKAACSIMERSGFEWLALSGHDWTIVRLEDAITGKEVPVTSDTELREGMRVIFLCSESATLKGYASYEEAEFRSRRSLEELEVGDCLPVDIRICRTDHAQKSGRVTIAGDNRYTLLRGARLVARAGSVCTFEYEPLHRLQRNFGAVTNWSCWGQEACLDVLRFSDAALAPRKRIGLKKGHVEGLDLRAAHGVSSLGVARKTEGGWKVFWNPPPDFSVLPGDHCITLPVWDEFPPATAALFVGRDRVSCTGQSCTDHYRISHKELDDPAGDLTPSGAPGMAHEEQTFSPRLGPALWACSRPPPFLVGAAAKIECSFTLR